MDELIFTKSKSVVQICKPNRSHVQCESIAKINIFYFLTGIIQVRMEVDDLFVDLADGRKLLKLLEIISGEKLGKPNNGRMRVHKVENVNKSLAFLHTKVLLQKRLSIFNLSVILSLAPSSSYNFA